VESSIGPWGYGQPAALGGLINLVTGGDSEAGPLPRSFAADPIVPGEAKPHPKVRGTTRTRGGERLDQAVLGR
jgi:hypothetical protein